MPVYQSHLIGFVRLPTYFRVTFDIKGSSLSAAGFFDSILEFSDDNGDVALGIYSSSERNLMILYNGNVVMSSAAELVVDYATEWTSYTVEVNEAYLVTKSSASSEEPSAEMYDPAPTYNHVYNVFACSPNDLGAGGFLRDINITGTTFVSLV